MVKKFASLMTPRAKHGKTAMHSWWWPVPLKMPVLVIDKSRVSLPANLMVKED